MPLRDQDTLLALAAGPSGACANALRAHIAMITFFTQWGDFFFLEEAFGSCELNIPD